MKKRLLHILDLVHSNSDDNTLVTGCMQIKGQLAHTIIVIIAFGNLAFLVLPPGWTAGRTCEAMRGFSVARFLIAWLPHAYAPGEYISTKVEATLSVR